MLLSWVALARVHVNTAHFYFWGWWDKFQADSEISCAITSAPRDRAEWRTRDRKKKKVQLHRANVCISLFQTILLCKFTWRLTWRWRLLSVSVRDALANADSALQSWFTATSVTNARAAASFIAALLFSQDKQWQSESCVNIRGQELQHRVVLTGGIRQLCGVFFVVNGIFLEGGGVKVPLWLKKLLEQVAMNPTLGRS